MEPVARVHDPLGAEWVTALFLGIFIALAAINRNAPRKWRTMVQESFRLTGARQSTRDELDLQDRNYLGLAIIAIAVVGLFAWQVMHERVIAPWIPYPMVTGILAAILIAYGFALRLSAGLLRTDTGITEYLQTGALIFTLLGMVLLPVVVLAAYRPEWREPLLNAGLVLAAGALVYRWVRGAWIGMRAAVPLRYIILYFCAAEAMPLLLAIHALRLPIHPASNL